MAEIKQSLTAEAMAMQKIGAEFEKLSPEAQNRVVNWLISIINTTGVFSQSTLQSSAITQPGQPQTKDIKGLWKEKAPKTNYEKLAVLGYFLEFIGKKEEFTKEDLKKLWKETREACPTEQVITNSINATLSTYQYFVIGSQGRRYRMGIRGQQLVESMPNPDKKLLGTAKRKGSRKNKAQK